MARRDGPTTMGAPFYGPGCIRSGTRMNEAAREQKARRKLGEFAKLHPENPAKIVKALAASGADFYSAAVLLELVEMGVPIVRRRLPRR